MFFLRDKNHVELKEQPYMMFQLCGFMSAKFGQTIGSFYK